MKSDFRLGDYYCEEKLDIEHKEFTLNKSRYELSKSKTIQFLKSFDFTDEVNELITKNILLYFSIYLPKYLTSFCNSQINGELNLGINDIGIITGIPMKYKISNEKIITHIQTILQNQVCKYENLQKLTNAEINNIKSNITIKVTKLDIDEENINTKINVKKLINNYFKSKKEIQQKLDFINNREEIWKKNMTNTGH